ASPVAADIRAVGGHQLARQPGVEVLTNQTLPETTQLIRELRETTARLGAIAAKLDEDPAGALVGGRQLPEYQPQQGKRK
ncbi:MAG: hypothetical protein RIS17_795, partial [Pseudomonadota bacterium]